MVKDYLPARLIHWCLIGVVGAVIAASGCSDSTSGAAKLSQGCSINSDCNSPLVCAFQRCHNACNTSRDCPTGERCVASDRPFHVCQLPIEKSCSANSDCPEGQVCGVDLECRDGCATLRDCVNGQLCVSATCADPQDLTPQGTLLPADSDSGTTPGGLPCSFNSDCPNPLLCRSGICAAECRTSGDCSPGLACDNSRCVVPLACAYGDGGRDPRAGGPCLYSSQCPVPLVCVRGYCSCECLGSADCAPGFACVANRCTPALGGASAVEIGPKGGTITSSDGSLNMEVPEGALDASIIFSVRAATAWPSGALGPVYEVEPSGTRFSRPATITLSYDGVTLGSLDPTALSVATAAGSAWQALGNTVADTKKHTLSSTTPHLSIFGLVPFGNTGEPVDSGIASGASGNDNQGGRTSQGGASQGGAGNGTGTGTAGSTGIGGAFGGGGFAGAGTAGSISVGGFGGGRGGAPASGGFGGAGATAGIGGVDAGACSGNCACQHVTDCPAGAGQVCCFRVQLKSSSCTSSIACSDAGGTVLQ